MGKRETTLDMGGDKLTLKVGDQETKLDLGKSTTEAMQSIELKVGSNSIKIDQTGVTISGIMLKLEGTAMMDVKAPITQVKGDGMLRLNGGITMINS
jgi:type VI secretion system secreted protein VgrG